MSSNSDCDKIVPKFSKLRKLREQLCDNQVEWKNAFDVKDFVVQELRCLNSMLESEDISKEMCLEKSQEILNYFSDNLKIKES